MKGIHIVEVNGYKNHCHCLVSLNAKQSIGEVMQLIKGESSYWINKEKLCERKFIWQDDYFAISVSKSQINRVQNYIINQEEHHSEVKYSEEYDEIIKVFEFEKTK